MHCLSIRLDETPVQTEARLRALATVHLAETVAVGGIQAAAVDGSLGTGRVWPSSDLDVTIVPAPENARFQEGPGVRWNVRDGLVVHTHINRRANLEKLRVGYPESFVQLAASDWVRDATWLLDGLATFRPVHDPGGFLAGIRAFVQAHRFAPEVVGPRRRLLLARARAFFDQARRDVSEYWLELAVDTLALTVLEADARIISHKEADPELRAACARLGAGDDLHRLFRAALGVGEDTAAARARSSLVPGFKCLLMAYSPYVDEVTAGQPPLGTADWKADWDVAWHAYRRHRIWSALYAPARDCLMYLGSVRTLLASGDLVREMPPSPSRNEITNACADILRAFETPPLAERLAAWEMLSQRVNEFFGVEAPDYFSS